MSDAWNANDFVQRLDLGEFNGRLDEALSKLTPEQLRHVCEILAKRNGGTPADGTSDGRVMAAAESLRDPPD